MLMVMGDEARASDQLNCCAIQSQFNSADNTLELGKWRKNVNYFGTVNFPNNLRSPEEASGREKFSQ